MQIGVVRLVGLVVVSAICVPIPTSGQTGKRMGMQIGGVGVVGGIVVVVSGISIPIPTSFRVSDLIVSFTQPIMGLHNFRLVAHCLPNHKYTFSLSSAVPVPLAGA